MTLMYFGEENRHYNTARPQYALARELLKKVPRKGSVLDVGSGLGEFADFLVKQGYQVSCVEGVEEFVLTQRQRGLDAQRVDLENDILPFESDSFDIIVSLDVIEHLWHTQHYLDQIRRCAKPDGYLIISTVNYNHHRYRRLHLLGRMGDFMFNSRHKKFYTLRSLPREMNAFFSIKDVVYHNGQTVSGRMMWPNLQALHFAFLCTPKCAGKIA